jgi:hypothetical protein
MDWTTSWMGDRRLGVRYPAASVPLGWNLDRPHHLFGRRARITAHVIDISLEGAAILGPDDPDLIRGRLVTVDWGGARAVIGIRHVEPGPVPRISLYGVEFEELSEPFARRLDRFVSDLRPASVEAQRPH